jgi:DNA-binding response OmpR family regulator
MESEHSILVIEDDAHIRELIEFNLSKQGFKVSSSETGSDGLQKASELKPHLIILDLMLPKMDGLSVLRRIRESAPIRKTPVLVLTAKTDESDILVGLELGADGYMGKPFSIKELVARVRALLRRSGDDLQPPLSSGQIEIGPVRIDVERHEVYLEGAPLSLTLAEFRILQCLGSKPGKVFTREELIGQMTGGEVVVVDRNIDVHIRSIRKKLDQHADLIITIRGIGYKCKG